MELKDKYKVVDWVMVLATGKFGNIIFNEIAIKDLQREAEALAAWEKEYTKEED
jgi:hypothetical protein